MTKCMPLRQLYLFEKDPGRPLGFELTVDDACLTSNTNRFTNLSSAARHSSSHRQRHQVRADEHARRRRPAFHPGGRVFLALVVDLP